MPKIQRLEIAFQGIPIAYNAKSEIEVDEVLIEVENTGAKILKPAEKVFTGGYNGCFKDINRHLFEFTDNRFVEFDEEAILKIYNKRILDN